MNCLKDVKEAILPTPNRTIGGKRHPEKQKNKAIPQPKRPEWLRVKAPNSDKFLETRNLMRDLNLVTVCEEAACPNIGECWSKKHATMMILVQFVHALVLFVILRREANL